jgi:hypothetical protein
MEPCVFIQIEENPNCAAVDGQVYQPRTPPRTVTHVRVARNGTEEWCDITGLDTGGTPTPATAHIIDDSGDGRCYLVIGGAWGLRLKHSSFPRSWDLKDPTQWGESYLLLPADGADLRFK